MRRLLPLLMMTAAPVYADVPAVATDIAPVHSLVAQVMKGVGTPDLVVAPGASPHGYAMRPSEARNLSGADLVVWVGPGLTNWLSDPLETLAGEAVHLELMEAEGMTLLPFRESAAFGEHDHAHGHDDHDEDHADNHDDHAHDDHDHDDHAHKEDDHDHAHDDHDHDAHEEDHAGNDHDKHEEDHARHDHDDLEDAHAGHDHGDTDPHIWLSPDNGKRALAAIAEQLAQMDPENAETYRSNAKEGQLRLESLSAEIKATLAPVKGQGFLVFHDAYQYFETSFDIEAVAAVSDSDAADPGAARVAELRGIVAERNVSCAFAEPQMNVGIMGTVIEGEEISVATIDPLGSELALGPDLYPDLLKAMADSMAGCLTPQG